MLGWNRAGTQVHISEETEFMAPVERSAGGKAQRGNLLVLHYQGCCGNLQCNY